MKVAPAKFPKKLTAQFRQSACGRLIGQTRGARREVAIIRHERTGLGPIYYARKRSGTG